MTPDLPILFSPEMIRANLADIKTQTRRLSGLKEINEAPDEWSIESTDDVSAVMLNRVTGEPRTVKCPYGPAGTRLWVREAWRGGNDTLEMVFYRASGDLCDRNGALICLHKWRPSIHMPRKFSRMTLINEGWRLQRLQEITEEDALAEGCRSAACSPYDSVFYPGTWTAKLAFARLWDRLNGKNKKTAWKANPWVRAINYRRAA